MREQSAASAFVYGAGGASAGVGWGWRAGYPRGAAPVAAGTTQITLRLVIFDATDGALDATALIDNFAWIAAGPVVPSTTASPTP